MVGVGMIRLSVKDVLITAGRTICACLLAAGLAACGGAGDASSPAAGIEKYLGTWTTCQVFGASPGATSTRLTFTLAKVSDRAAAIERIDEHYPDSSTCGGVAAGRLPAKGTVTFVGGTRIGGISADKVDIDLQFEGFFNPVTAASNKSKWLFAIRPDGQLYGGTSEGVTVPGASFNDQTYPSAIDATGWVFTTK